MVVTIAAVLNLLLLLLYVPQRWLSRLHVMAMLLG
jgi:hypothetical protein